MLLLIPLLPLVGFLVNAGAGRRLSKAVSGGVAVGAMALSFAAAAAASASLLRLPPGARVIDQSLYTWIASGELDVTLGLRLDPLSMVMILVVTGIGALIHLYSTSYMHEETDAEYARYFSYLNLFAAFMLILVLAPSFPVMFVGWEGVGLCSYLLIGFWYRKQAAADAGKKAFIVNRIGDAGFLLGMALLFTRFGTLDFAGLARAIAPLAPEAAAFGTLSAAALLLFVGATGKSAQLPLYVWLPDAMEGPTPVSALIHAATMVTAGVYMIGRNAVLYSHAPGVMEIVAVVGVLTALFAATIGLVQTDIKRVLAYSTVSQLGLMFLAMGVGAFGAGIFHLYTHAFFKALLFLGAGAVIHALAGEQDLRRMGGLKRHLPVTYWTFLVGALAIAGVPGLSGFFSKDEVLYRTFASGHPLLWAAGAAASLLTAIYMFRLVFLAFHGPAEASGAHGAHAGTHGGHGAGPAHPHEAPPSMAVVLVALAIGAVVAGYVGIPAALGGGNRIEAFLEPSFHPPAEGSPEGLPHQSGPEGLPHQSGPEGLPHASSPEGLPAGATAGSAGSAHEAHDTGLELGLMGVSTAIALGGIAVAALFFLRRRDLADAWASRYRGLHRLLLHKYYVDELYDAAIVQPVKTVSAEVLWKGVDAGLIDGAVNGAGVSVRAAAGALRQVQTGSLRSYAASLFVGVLLVLGYFLWP